MMALAVDETVEDHEAKFAAYVERTQAERAKRPVMPARRNSMDGPTKAVDVVLTEWGRWMRNANSILGWRTCSLTEKLMIERDGANQSTAPVEIPDGVMEVDAAVAKLGKIRQLIMQAVYVFFPDDESEIQRRRFVRKFKVKITKRRWDSLLGESRMGVAMQLGLIRA